MLLETLLKTLFAIITLRNTCCFVNMNKDNVQETDRQHEEQEHHIRHARHIHIEEQKITDIDVGESESKLDLNE